MGLTRAVLKKGAAPRRGDAARQVMLNADPWRLEDGVTVRDGSPAFDPQIVASRHGLGGAGTTPGCLNPPGRVFQVGVRKIVV